MDPSGFEPDIGVVSQPGYPDVPLPDDVVTPGPGFQVARYLNGGPPPAAPVVESSHANEAPSEAAEVGAAAPPTDVDTTGSSSEYVPQPVTTAPEDWAQNPYVQIEGGFLGGLMLGVVPFAGVGQQLLDTVEVLPHGTPQARLGMAVGQIVGGVITTAGGVTGELLGGAASVTGIGAAVGVPGIVASTGLVVGGVGNIAAGIQGLSQSLMSTGAGNSSPQALPAARGGATALEQASSAASKAAQNASSFQVGAKHLAGAGGKWAKFAERTNTNELLREALSSPGARFYPNDATSFRVVTDLGRVVGTKGETGVRAILDLEGHVVTWFPVKP